MAIALIDYGVNDLINTPLWTLLERDINSINYNWEDGRIGGWFDEGKSAEGRDDNDIRKCKIAWLTNIDLRTEVFHSVNLYNKQNWNYDLDGTESFQYGIYSDGGHYNWHIDTAPKIGKHNDKYLSRKLSMTIWLNDPDEYEGGELDIEVHSPLKEIRYDTLKLSKGSIVIFPSNKWHRVRPVTSGERKSLVGWFSGPPFR